jgi:hypothetical protein
MALALVLDENCVDLDLPHGPAESTAMITVEPMVPLVPAFGSTKARTRSKAKTLLGNASVEFCRSSIRRLDWIRVRPKSLG